MTRNGGYFSFERLDAWRVADEALGLALRERGRWRGLPGDVADQAMRALISVVNNIAEGSGRETVGDQRRHYAIARGSANEAGAALNIIRRCGMIDDRSHEAIRSRLIRVVQMLNKMIW
jgi:four helix bundle protein